MAAIERTPYPDGQTVLISGGGSGVGRAIALAFAQQGSQIHILGRDAAKLESVAAASPLIHTHIADTTSENELKTTLARIPKLDVVIASAGSSDTAPFAKTNLQLWQQTLNTNLTGTYLLFHLSLPLLINSPKPRMIAIASTAGLKGYPLTSAYCAAKHGIVGLVRAIAAETHQRQELKNLTVNAICPGFLDTPMTERNIQNIAQITQRDPVYIRQQLAELNPHHQLIPPEDVAAGAIWLASPAANNLNGQTITIAGGNP